ncbi:hypothetical protein K491DRAFT_180874 [Lophiostoma macrostomum CBS 122681]|uniref:Uncharacterized protein n=1 Tax=Lophiostoma macrostomum CBS 122681 TaxID=1314788 RepID=A0A6A6TR17_9PLEO|nr:hypothetical protein K491DRAFT_180874 [Lophiostoma macrostomum CBS 122681]
MHRPRVSMWCRCLIFDHEPASHCSQKDRIRNSINFGICQAHCVLNLQMCISGATHCQASHYGTRKNDGD